jgi:DNA-binding transcriptional ArsR family regulator
MVFQWLVSVKLYPYDCFSRFLGQGERGVDSVARLAGLSVGNASQPLQRLCRAGLLDVRRGGKHVLYRLVDGDPEWKAAGRPVETARTA